MSAGPPAQTSTISYDLECLACGYNLRGLTWAGRCPECGTLIRDTYISRSKVRTDPLEDADPAWLRSLARGVALLLLSIVPGVLALGTAPRAADLWVALGVYPADPRTCQFLAVAPRTWPDCGRDILWGPYMLWSLNWVATAAWGYGIWLLSRRQPRGKGDGTPLTCVCLRVSVVLAVCLHLFALAVPDGRAYHKLAMVPVMLTLLTDTGAIMATYYRLIALALRSPSASPAILLMVAGALALLAKAFPWLMISLHMWGLYYGAPAICDSAIVTAGIISIAALLGVRRVFVRLAAPGKLA